MAPKPDQLTDQELARQYTFAWRVIQANDELLDLFTRASAGDSNWSTDRFLAKVRGTTWWRENDANARTAWAAQVEGGADWQDQLDAAKSAVRDRATQLGFQVADSDLEGIATDYIYGGWQTAARAGQLDKALGGDTVEGIATQKSKDHAYATKLSGGVFDRTRLSLRTLAEANGVKYADSWYESAAKSVAMGLSTVEQWTTDIRTHSASMHPVFAEKIMAGMDAMDLASPYINRMAETLEIDPSSITLGDPYIKEAFGGVDEKGNPKAVNLWDFEKTLKRDSRWAYTKNASDKAGQITSSILQMFGMGG